MNILNRIGAPANGTSTHRNLGARVIATFGDARLLRQPGGRHELIGGTASDRADAREWCSLFAPEVVFRTIRPQS